MRWFRRLFRKEAVEKQLDAELCFHIEQQISDYIAEGMNPGEARRRAQAEFGGVERVKEECRDVRWETHADNFLRDVRYAVRTLWRSRAFAAAAMVTLALGIGASTAIFSAIDNVLLDPFPYKDSRHIVTIAIRGTDQNEQDRRNQFSFPELQTFVRQNRVFDSIVANAEDDILYTTGDSTFRFGGDYVTPNTFEFFGVAPLLGRSLEPTDYKPGAPPVFVMRYVSWINQFGGDPSTIGKSYMLNGTPRTMVGVMPLRFAWGGADLWMPRNPVEPDTVSSDHFQRDWYWGAVGRLKPGVSIPQAEADLGVIAQQLATVHPEEYPKHFTVKVETLADAVVGSRFRDTLFILFAAVALLLLIGCGNVANLLLARSATREKEFAVRTALGAGRWRLVRQLLAESLVLASGGSLLGALIAWGGIHALAAQIPAFTIASESVIRMNGLVLVFALLVGMSTTLIFGLAPALQVGRRDLSDALRDCVKGPGGGSVRAGVHNAVIVCEVAFSLTILIAAGMFMRSFVALTQVKLGLRPDHVLAARIPLSPDRYKTASQVAGFFQPLLARLKSMPGVAYATETSAIPPYGGIRSAVQVSGKVHTENWPSIFQLCSEDYLSVLRIQLMQGRTFTESEVNDARKLAVINQTFQSQYLGTGNPIGARIHLDELNKFPDAVTDPWFEVIGVVADAKNHGLQDPVVPEAWLPYTVTGSAGRGILVRTVNDPAMMVNAVRREIWRTDHNVAMAFAETLENFLNIFSYGQPRFGLLLVSIFAVIGLILVATGVYSVIAYATARRTHEIGIRMALGAASGDVQKLVVRTGLRLVAAGIAVGLLASLGLSRIIAKELWGVSPYDPLTLAAVPALLLFVALLACWIPARRAAGVDPLVALRHE